jgi:hypothetical protein
MQDDPLWIDVTTLLKKGTNGLGEFVTNLTANAAHAANLGVYVARLGRLLGITEIDLHIEELHPQPDGLSNSEKMRIQLEVFEKNLNQAIAAGMDQITFVHGIGNGVLRKEIHKRLSQLENISYFQDTQKDQWGYGATLVKIS